jgi:hypothetical protein
MPMPIKDLCRRRFGRLVVLNRNGSNEHGKVVWSCQCDCGAVADVTGNHLKHGNTRSCGCLALERSSQLEARPASDVAFNADSLHELKLDAMAEVRRRGR